jgi:hypothetical protein
MEQIGSLFKKRPGPKPTSERAELLEFLLEKLNAARDEIQTASPGCSRGKALASQIGRLVLPQEHLPRRRAKRKAFWCDLLVEH